MGSGYGAATVFGALPRRPERRPATSTTGPASYPAGGADRHTGPVPEPESEITCIDCGGRAFLLSVPREDGRWLPGDIVAYRCSDCAERFDVELTEDDVGERED